ncbi:hypothetical protein M0802_007804 [Mischocyttarus mexicanus]|nr:hypothetical protein M0802_007804 [Mischocyttarus mexicanus]
MPFVEEEEEEEEEWSQSFCTIQVQVGERAYRGHRGSFQRFAGTDQRREKGGGGSGGGGSGGGGGGRER